MKEKNNIYKVGTYTNPFVWVMGAGVFVGCFLESVFGGTIRNMKKVLK